MGRLKDLVGAGRTVDRYVTTPFMGDAGLRSEVQSQWVLGSAMSNKEFRSHFEVSRDVWHEREMKRKVNVTPIIEARFSELIEAPERSVLYVLGHSDRNVAEIGGTTNRPGQPAVEWWTPQQLVQWLTGGPQPLPRRMLCVKIWSCYSATNGFLAEFSRQMVRVGYRDTWCVGYTRITGAMYGKRVVPYPPHTKAMLTADETTVLGRGKDFQQVMPLPRRMPPPPVPQAPVPQAPVPQPMTPIRALPPRSVRRPVAPPEPARPVDDDPYADLDVPAELDARDRAELPPTFLGPRQGAVKH